MSKSGGNFRAEPGAENFPQARALLALEEHQGLDVLWTMTSSERESRLLAVRIPIDKGLLGWRLLLVRSSDAGRFAGISQSQDQQTLLAGQGHDWPDLEVLKANGYKVTPVNSHQVTLFAMLARGRIDYFPRALDEVFVEAVCQKALNITIQPTLALHYKAAKYFFVNKQDADLAAAIERGLEASLRDGSFDRLFLEFHAGFIAAANLAQRQVFSMRNPILPDGTPVERRELWWDPSQQLPAAVAKPVDDKLLLGRCAGASTVNPPR